MSKPAQQGGTSSITQPAIAGGATQIRSIGPGTQPSRAQPTHKDPHTHRMLVELHNRIQNLEASAALFAGSRLLKNLPFTAGVSQNIAHQLGRPYQGFIVTGLRPASNASATASRRLPGDAYDAIVWALDGATPLANTGTFPGGSLSTVVGTINTGRTGLFSTCIEVSGGSSYIRTTDSSTLNPTSTTALTTHGWIKVNAVQAGATFGHIISKWFNTTYTGAAPDAFAVLLNASSSQVYAQAYNGGANKSTAATTVSLPLNQWCHVAVTFNAGTVNIYFNGNLVLTDATFPAALNWNGASGGYWSLGGVLTATQGLTDSELDEWRVEDGIVRSQAFFQNVYLTGMGLPASYASMAAGALPTGFTSDKYISLVSAISGTFDVLVF